MACRTWLIVAELHQPPKRSNAYSRKLNATASELSGMRRKRGGRSTGLCARGPRRRRPLMPLHDPGRVSLTAASEGKYPTLFVSETVTGRVWWRDSSERSAKGKVRDKSGVARIDGRIQVGADWKLASSFVRAGSCIGLTRWLSKPASRHFFRSSSCPQPVKATTSIPFPPGWPRIRRHTS
jgi:hypothetical protein